MPAPRPSIDLLQDLELIKAEYAAAQVLYETCVAAAEIHRQRALVAQAEARAYHQKEADRLTAELEDQRYTLARRRQLMSAAIRRAGITPG